MKRDTSRLYVLFIIFFAITLGIQNFVSVSMAAVVVLDDSSSPFTLSGSSATVYGTENSDTIVVPQGISARFYNFQGNNTIIVNSSSTLFSVSRSGALVTFQGTEGTRLTLPATQSVQTLTFDDASFNFTITGNQVMLGGQIVSQQASPIGSTTTLLANAGENQVVNKYTLVALNGSGSVNADTYKWKQTLGPTVALSNDTSMAPTFTPISSANYTFLLTVTNDTGTHSDEVEVTAQDIATVSITSPTSQDSVAVAESTIELSGQAGQTIETISVINTDTGTRFPGQLGGDGTFTIQNVQLTQGDNLLEVAGVDNTGSETIDSLLVTYNDGVTFLSAPMFTTDSAYVDETVDTVVSIAIQENQNIATDGVTLVQLDDGAPLQTSDAVLYDDGNVSNGDDIAGDGVYTAKLSIMKTQAGIIYYRVAADTNGVKGYSAPVSFNVLTPLTDNTIQSAQEKTEAVIDENLPEVGSQFTSSEFTLYKDKMVSDLTQTDSVSSTQISPDGNSILVEFESGLKHSIDFVYKGTKSGGRLDSSSRKLSDLQPKVLYYPVKKKSMPQYTIYQNAASTDKDAIGSYRAMALSPFKWQFDPWDDIDAAYDEIQDSTTPEFTAESPVLDYDVTVEHFKKFSQYGVVVISSHGGLNGNDPVIYTGEEATTDKQKTYQKDINAKRLMISHKITILVEDGGFLWFDSKEKKKVFKIAPSFITHYNSNLPNTLVYMSICQGVATDGLANAFIASGAGAFLGFTDIVDASYAYNTGKTFFQSMIAGKTVKDALKDATDAHGLNDGGNTPAAFVYRGNGDLVLERLGLQNGGFEENLKYWEENGGDIRIISQLAGLTPQEGSYMAILSSGLGSVSDSEAIITQQFKIPSGTTNLSFMYNVVSEEPEEWVGTEFDDKFRVVLIDENGNETQLAYETVNTSSWSPVTGSQSDGGMFDGGDETAYHTGWKMIDHAVQDLEGKTVTLKFRVWDVGDSIYDTAALIDKIKLQ